MSLPWVRLDTNIASHDKILDLINRPGGHRAAAVYLFALAWSGGHGTDGHIPQAALPMIHGKPTDARTLVDTRLWDYDPDGNGWHIRNYALRQELTLTTEIKRRARHLAAARTNCTRWHTPDCECWKETE